MAAAQGPLSGFRDMLAEQMIARNAMLSTIQAVYESYGFTPLKTPAIERLETLTGKYGEEGDKLMYKFKDNGDRDVALRYDLTVPLARVVAQYSGSLPVPYKRYAVGEVWRGESPQAGRYREFTQFDADIVGSDSPLADAEMVAMMSDTMTALGANAVVRVNNRLLLDGLAAKAGVADSKQALRLISAVDKVEKMGREDCLEYIGKEFGDQARDAVGAYLSVDGEPRERLERLRELLPDDDNVKAGIANLESVFGTLEAAGYSADKVTFDQTIARGLDYYTGIIYETTLQGAPGLGSVCSGGRYDRLVKSLGGPDLPAVGTSIGVDRLYDGLQQLGKLQTAQTTTQVLITNFDAQAAPRYLQLATQLRQAGVAAEVYYETAKLGKQIGFADKLNIPYVLIVGPKEIERGVVIVRDLASSEQTEVPAEQLVETINRLRKKSS